MKINKNAACGYSLLTQFSFDNNQNKYDYYRSKNCMESFCKYLRENVQKKTNY